MNKELCQKTRYVKSIYKHYLHVAHDSTSIIDCPPLSKLPHSFCTKTVPMGCSKFIFDLLETEETVVPKKKKKVISPRYVLEVFASHIRHVCKACWTKRQGKRTSLLPCSDTLRHAPYTSSPFIHKLRNFLKKMFISVINLLQSLIS